MPRGYLVVMLATIMVVLGAVAAVSVAFDPYGYMPSALSVLPPNAERAGRVRNDRIIKPIDVALRRPAVLILGTSRVKQTFDPSFWDSASLGTAYNGGIDAASLGEMRAILETAISESPNLKYVFVELFFQRFLKGSPLDATSGPYLNPVVKFTTPFRLYASTGGLRQSIETYIAWRKGTSIPEALASDGSLLKDRPAADGTSWTMPYVRVYMNRVWEPVLSEDAFDEYERIRALCSGAAIRCVFFISPLSAVWLGTLHSDNHWTAFEQWKHRMAGYGDVVDFALPDAPFWEYGNAPMPHWYDTSHFSKLSSRLMADAFLRHLAGEEPKPGVVLSPATVGAQVAAWPEALAAWAAHLPSFPAAFEAERRRYLDRQSRGVNKSHRSDPNRDM